MDVIAPDENAWISRHDHKRHLLLIERVLQVLAVAVGEDEVDHGRVDFFARFQMFERLTDQWEWSDDICPGALQPVSMVESN